MVLLLRRFGPLLLAALGFCIPLFSSNEYLVHSVLAKVCIYVILVAGLDLVVGYCGDISAGHAGLLAVGAYTSAVLCSKYGWSWPATVPIAVGLTALFGVILGVPALRLSGPYLAVTTIAFGIIIQTIINETVWLTEGSLGITGLRADGKPKIPDLRYAGFNFEGNNFYYLTYGFMLLTLFLKRQLVTSYWGRAFEAMKANTLAAECSGVSRYRFKLGAFIISAALAGLAGSLFIHLNKYCGPLTFSPQLSVDFLIMLIFGGTRSLLGNVIGCFVVVLLPDFFNEIAAYQLLIFGSLLLFTLYFLPGGAVGLLTGIVRKLFPAVVVPPTMSSGAAVDPAKAHAEAAQLHVQPIYLREASADGAPILKTDELTIAFGGLVAVNKFTFDVRPGEVHALIGPNGSGKSTTVNLLSGVYQPTGGSISFIGQNLRGLPNHISHLGIARTFQNVALFGDMTVIENVMVGLHHTFHRTSLLDIFFASPRARREERAARGRAQLLLDFVGLGNLAAERAKNLPYGRQRLLEIARALAQNPALVLLDEPAAGLTSGEIADVDKIICKIKAAGLSTLLIEHHMDLVMNVSDRITVLDFGQKIAEGSPAEIQRNERVISAYLGAPIEELPPAASAAIHA